MQDIDRLLHGWQCAAPSGNGAAAAWRIAVTSKGEQCHVTAAVER